MNFWSHILHCILQHVLLKYTWATAHVPHTSIQLNKIIMKIFFFNSQYEIRKGFDNNERQVWTNWAKISQLKQIFWSVEWVAGFLWKYNQISELILAIFVKLLPPTKLKVYMCSNRRKIFGKELN